MAGSRYCPKCGSENITPSPVTFVPDAKPDWNLCSACNCVSTVRGPGETIYGYLEGDQWKPRVTPLHEKYMTVSWVDDLYLMQNQYGLIKVGRSIEPRKRLKALQKAGQCEIVLVLVIPEKGEREEAIHRKLKKFRMTGEWFEGSEQARAAVGTVIRTGAGIEWPFQYDVKTAEQWLDQLVEQADVRYNRQQFQNVLRALKNTSVLTVGSTVLFGGFSCSAQLVTMGS